MPWRASGSAPALVAAALGVVAGLAGAPGTVSAAQAAGTEPPAAEATAAMASHAAPVVVRRAGTYVELPLPVAAYTHSRQTGLADLRIIDAAGDRVPHAWLADREEPAPETVRSVALYPLPPSQPGAATSGALEVTVQGDRVVVRRAGAGPVVPVPPPPERPSGQPSATPTGLPPGWLIDLGERPAPGGSRTTERSGAAPPAALGGAGWPQTLRLRWSGPAQFSVGFDIDTGSTLRDWRPAGTGQLLALPAPNGPGVGSSTGNARAALVQRDFPLNSGASRYLRLTWHDASAAPTLTSAEVVDRRAGGDSPPSDTADASRRPPTDLLVAAGREPDNAAPAPGSLHYDLGGVLPLSTLALRLPPGTRVAPVRLQGRRTLTDSWTELGATVFYRLQRNGIESASPPFTVDPRRAWLRYVRVLPDERAGTPDPATTALAVQARLATLVFAAQGRPPYTVQVGSTALPLAALPFETLVPSLGSAREQAEERQRFGQAEVGAFTARPEALQAGRDAERRAALRPWLLWGVLLTGVAAIGFMVWRLARGRAPEPPAAG